jgi:hypothetical protein
VVQDVTHEVVDLVLDVVLGVAHGLVVPVLVEDPAMVVDLLVPMQ